MTGDQLKELRDIHQKLNQIRGNEEEVEELKNRVHDLIRQEVTSVKDKINALAEEF